MQKKRIEIHVNKNDCRLKIKNTNLKQGIDNQQESSSKMRKLPFIYNPYSHISDFQTIQHSVPIFFGWLVMMIILFDEAQSAISARMVSGFILQEKQNINPFTGFPTSYKSHQVDVDLGMTQWTITAVTGDHTLRALFRWNLGNQIDSPVLVHHTAGVGKAQITIVILFKHL